MYEEYFDSSAHKNRVMHILEIGAGTGGATAPVLDIVRLRGDFEHGVPTVGFNDTTTRIFSLLSSRRLRNFSQNTEIGYNARPWTSKRAQMTKARALAEIFCISILRLTTPALKTTTLKGLRRLK